MNGIAKYSHWLAKVLFRLGVKPGYSTGICESITSGYGKLDDNGYWEYPLYFV